ncbi:Aftiphilin [Acipenser ruthenus]|uniref:Aftiphilin n=1 Tax=Acipenser ruthenus TaxID=7906 RepID=A0A444UJD0_ACIRT|nr:Aftiphilin [Acipenser ruthenus]
MLQHNNNNNYLCLERGCHNRKLIVENSGECGGGGGGGGGGDNLPQATSETERRGAQRQGPKIKGLRNRTVSRACAKNRKKARLTKPDLQALSQALGGITACQTRLVSDSLVNNTISCLNTSRSYSSRSEKSHDGPGILTDVSALSRSSISSLRSPVTVATLEASEVNQTVAPTTVKASFLSTTARDQYYSTGRIYISLTSQPQAIGRHDFLLNLRGREDRNMTGEAAFPGQEDGVVRSSNGDGKAVETNAQPLAKDVIIAGEGFKTATVHESCGNAVEQKKGWGFAQADVDKQGEDEDDVKESIVDPCVLGRRDTKNAGAGSAEDCMRSGFNRCTQSDDVQRKLVDPRCEHQKCHPGTNKEGSRQLAGDLVTENKQAISAASELHNHCCCLEMTLENRSGHWTQGDKNSRTEDHVDSQIQKRNAGDWRSGITCRGCHRQGNVENGQSERRITDLAKYETPNHNPAESSGEMTDHATVRVKKLEGTSSRKTNRLDSRPVEKCTADTSDLAEYYRCNPGGCECCEITSLRQRKLHGVCHEEADNVRHGHVCASNRGDSYEGLATHFASALGNSQFEACASVQQLAQGERLGAGSCGNHFSECAKVWEKHPSLALDSLTGKTECTPMPKDLIYSHRNDSAAQSQGLKKKAGRMEQGALLSGFHTSQAGEQGSDSDTAPVSDNTLPMRFDKPAAAAARPDLSVSVTKATLVAQESSAEVGGHSPSLCTTGEISNHDSAAANDREGPSIEQAGDDEEFGLFEKAGDRLHWDEGFAEFEQVPCWHKGCADVAVSPQSTSLDGWTAFSEEDTSGFGPGKETEQDRDSGGQWWLDSAVEETRTIPSTPLDLSRIFQDCFPSVTSSHWETDKVPSLREQMQRPASSLWEGLQDVNEAIGLKYKWAGSGAQKLLLHSLHSDLTNVGSSTKTPRFLDSPSLRKDRTVRPSFSSTSACERRDSSLITDPVACPQLSRASPDHRLNLFEQRTPAERIRKIKFSYDPNKNMLA